MAKAIIVAERDNIAAVMEDGKISEFFVHRGEILLNDVYLATVDNVLPSIDAAFINVGSDKMGFLHANDAVGKGSLKDKFVPKQKIIVQVIKEPTGHKGPKVTNAISLPGRFLVLMPSEPGINVSRKIVSTKERARLKSIISLIKPVGLGVIVRTEAEGQSDADIQEDLELLLEKWNSIITAAETRVAPSLLFRDQDLLYRVMREACDEEVEEIILDTPYGMHRTQQILQNWNMNRNIAVNVYKGTEPLLVASGVVKEIKNALHTKVNMPSGGYLFIQTTEALTVVDVNSGKFVSSATQDETILRTNLEAVHEIARQLRLRNIGGMIIIDFIDMTNRNDKLAIMEELELALDKDKAKPQVGQLSDLGLVELTRHRQGQSLAEIFSKKCPHCQGTGYIAEDLTFSAPLAEGEYKAKASKMKLSGQQIKNKNQSNNKFSKSFENLQSSLNQPANNKPENINNSEQKEVHQTNNNVEKNLDNDVKQQNNKKNFNKNNKFNKRKFEEVQEQPVQNNDKAEEKVQGVDVKPKETQAAEQKPVEKSQTVDVEKQAVVESDIKSEAKVEKENKPKKRATKKSTNSTTKTTRKSTKKAEKKEAE